MKFTPDRDNPPLVQAMKLTSAILRENDIPHVLTGGFAVYARGGAMIMDHDVDFLILPSDTTDALNVLQSSGFRTLTPPEGWLTKAYFEDNLVDLIHAPNNRLVTQQLLDDHDLIHVWGQPIPVLSATWQMVHKLLAFGVHYCNYSDAILMARILAPEIDWGKVDSMCENSPYAVSFLNLARSLGLRS